MNSHRSVTAAITSIPDHSPADNETTDSESLDAEKISNESITAEENIAEADEETHPAVSFEDSLTVYTGSLSSDITDMNAVAEAVEGTVDSKTRGFQAVDISFRDKDGPPADTAHVSLRSLAAP